MARSCLVWASQGDGCTCRNSLGNVIEYQPTGSSYTTNHWGGHSVYRQCCINEGVGAGCASGSSKPVLTGQSVKWRRQSGETEEGTILGLTTTQLLIAGAVGVGAYLLMKKKK